MIDSLEVGKGIICGSWQSKVNPWQPHQYIIEGRLANSFYFTCQLSLTDRGFLEPCVEGSSEATSHLGGKESQD